MKSHAHNEQAHKTIGVIIELVAVILSYLRIAMAFMWKKFWCRHNRKDVQGHDKKAETRG